MGGSSATPGAAGGSGGMQASSQSKPPSTSLKQTLQQINKLQTTRVPPLVQLSVCAVRNALAGPIELNVDALLRCNASPQQRPILRRQILLEDILCANALQGVDDAFASVDALDATLSKVAQSKDRRGAPSDFFPVFLLGMPQDASDEDDPNFFRQHAP